jgi:hypothetical protein
MRALSVLSFVCASFLFAVTAPSASAQSGDVPEWVNVLKSKLVEHICKDGGVWLECYEQRASDCPKIARDFVFACVDKAARSAPSQVDKQVAADLSKSMVDCFNKTFETNYGAWQKRTPECSRPPQHLQ